MHPSKQPSPKQSGPPHTPEAVAPRCEAFEWLRSEEIASLNVTMEEYRHRETGAVHYHLATDNPENVFLVAFRTVPMDSTGVAHILEHTALCGSARYPVRDPFFMMIRRSLNTFMNAFTSSDWTAYPFASRNRKDFFNLLSVYLDAAFFSRLHELDFAQEGHRLEFTDAADSTTPLQYKGIVYNEMKGAMSSTNSVLWQAVTQHLFPTTTYHYNSGGDPAQIPDLTYDQLTSFYRTHYHPSNAVFMTFGDIPAAELQAQFHELALDRFKRLEVDISVPDEKRYLAPIRVEDFYDCREPEGEHTHVVLAWLLGKSIDLRDLFEAQLLNSVLLDNSASPLLRALESSNLGSSPSPMCGLEDSYREMSFMCGLEGCAEHATAEVEALVIATLERIRDEGVPQEQVEAALHQLELHQREITGDSYPYGLQLILASLSPAVHRGDPLKLLNIDPVLDSLREEIQDRGYIPRLIDSLLLNNTHRLTLTLRPDASLASRQVAAERSRLERILASLSPQEVDGILLRSKALNERQARVDDPDLLPKVGLEDIPASLDQPQPWRGSLNGSACPVSVFSQGTNGLCYQQVILNLPEIEDELLEVLPHYTSCLTELGVGDLDFAAVQTWQSQVSGGINFYSSIRSLPDDPQRHRAFIVLSSKALQRNHGLMTDLLARTMSDVRFDEGQRVRDLIDQICDRRVSSITGQGHSLAMSLAASRMSPTSLLAHRVSGLEGILKIKELKTSLKTDSNLEELLGKLLRLHRKVQAAPRQFLSVAEAEYRGSILDDLQQHWGAAPRDRVVAPLRLKPVRELVHEAWTTTTQVNFCARAYPTVPSSHADHAPLTVLAGFLRNGILHRTIREQGGAYGGGAEQDGNSASFRFYSYRDPRLAETLADFDHALEWLMEGPHQPYQLEEAILGVISGIDKPSSPAGEAKRAFHNALFGRDLDFLRQFRERILAVTLDDLRRVTATWLLEKEASTGIVTNVANLADSGLEGLEIRSL